MTAAEAMTKTRAAVAAKHEQDQQAADRLLPEIIRQIEREAAAGGTCIRDAAGRLTPAVRARLEELGYQTGHPGVGYPIGRPGVRAGDNKEVQSWEDHSTVLVWWGNPPDDLYRPGRSARPDRNRWLRWAGT